MTLAERDAKYQEYLRNHPGKDPEILSYESLLDRAAGRRVKVFGGYSGLGYQDPEVVHRHVDRIVRETGDGTLYVLGGTKDGIGEAYDWIRSLARSASLGNVKTAGIVSREAALYPDGIARQDYLVFVDTELDVWEVRRDGLSLMVDVAKRTGGDMVYFKGGAISGAEIQEALDRRVKVTIYAGPDIQPSREHLDKKKKQNPAYVADGTLEILARYEGRRHPLLTVLR